MKETESLMKTLIAGSLVALATVTNPAFATEPETGPYYVRLFGAAALTDDTDYRTSLGRFESEFDTGFVVGGAAGLDTNWIADKSKALRLELEYAYRESDVDDHVLGGAALAGSGGEFSANTVMANVLFDFFRDRPVSVYVGGGLGVAFTDFRNFGITGTSVLDDDDAVFAYQGIGGVEYAINKDWSVFGEYRYLGLEDSEVTLAPAAGGTWRNIEMDSHNFGPGVRLRF